MKYLASRLVYRTKDKTSKGNLTDTSILNAVLVKFTIDNKQYHQPKCTLPMEN